jgi:hypothetical protein
MDGMEMGVLPDGTPYLTARALARICGQSTGAIAKLTSEWQRERTKPRGRIIAGLLLAQGHTGAALIIHVQDRGVLRRVLPDTVCMAILEYYAFESSTKNQYLAQTSYRILARKSLRQFIYGRVGYDPNARQAAAWQHLHDRMMLNPAPPGYFSLLREITDLLIAAVQSGLALGPHTLPDISVGVAWGKHWTTHDLDTVYGARVKHPHRFPDAFPQMEVVEAWTYPDTARGAFRGWLRDHYLPYRLPQYLASKAKSGALPAYRVEPLLSALSPAV